MERRDGSPPEDDGIAEAAAGGGVAPAPDGPGEGGRAMAPADALREAARAAGLTLAAREVRPVLRALAGQPIPPPEAALRAALAQVRGRAPRERLAALARAAPGLPARPDDLDVALSAPGLGAGSAGDGALLGALRAAVVARLGGFRAPQAALAAALEDLPRGPASAEPTLEAVEHCAGLVAEAFALPGADAEAFARRAVDAEKRRRSERRAAARAARETREAEERRLKAWESSLVGAGSVPALLGCSRDEAERWIREGLIPVARRVTRRERGRVVREAEFDPAILEMLRASVPAWRAPPAAPARPSPPPPRRGEQPPAAAPAPALPRETRAQARQVNAAVARVAGMDRYAAHFTTARALDRRIIACLGPTNSGKTHFGLARLAEAETGVALGPLRLLAHEYREALEARGVPCALSTGEERIVVPDARHVAATVEMCPFRNPVDVAVVDEAQMLDDADRGAAWTAAIMGVPARTVIVLGAPDAAPMIRRIAGLCGDPVEELRTQRMGPLVAAREPVRLSEVGRGDAVVAFSRREVFALRAALLRMGRTVAVVYGALGPTVRRAEARRFREGEAEVLVATDAIGMGLNIGPLRRVVFSALAKWDGQQERPLSAQEIKQIGGRAGRFGGEHAEGVVAVLAGGGEPAAVARALAAGPELPEDLRPRVAPDADIVAAVAAEIGTDSLFGTLRRIERSVLRRDDPNYRLGDLSTQVAIAAAVDGVKLSLMDRWTYALCPVDERDEGVARLADWAVEHAMGGAVEPPRAGRLPPPERAGQEALQLAERVHRRLVAWRWMALRFPQAYRDLDGALEESRRLNEWIEAVLATQPAEGRAVPRGVSAASGPRSGSGRGGGPRRRPGAGPAVRTRGGRG